MDPIFRKAIQCHNPVLLYIEEIETVGTCHTTQTRKHQERTKNPDKQQSTESELKSFGDTTDKKCANDEETS